MSSGAALGATPWLTRVAEPGRFESGGDLVEGGDLQRAGERLDALGLEPEWDVLHGENPATSMISWGKTHGVALYIVGAHSRSGLRELVFGSVANHLVHQADRPVVVVGPNVR